MTQDEIIAQMIAEQEQLRQAGGGVTPPPLPHAAQPQTINIGGQQVSFSNPAELQQALNNYSFRVQQEAAQAARLNAPPPPIPSSSPNASVPTPGSRWDVEAYAKALQADPINAHDIALGQALKLPEGMPASEVLSRMAQGFQALQTELATVKQTQQQAFDAQALTRTEMEIQRFKEIHPEYQTTPNNHAVLERYRQELSLPPTAQGWDLAMLKAQQMGEKLDLRQAQEQMRQGVAEAEQRSPYGFVQNPQAPPTFMSVPSMRNAGSVDSSGSVEAMLSHLDSLPKDQWESAAASFGRALSTPNGRR